MFSNLIDFRSIYSQNIHQLQCSYSFPSLRLKTLDERLNYCYVPLNDWDNPGLKDWKTFEGNGFVFKYPSNWRYERLSGFKMNKDGVEYYIGIDGVNLPFDEATIKTQDDLEVLEKKPLFLDGRKTQRSVNIFDSGNKYIEYLIQGSEWAKSFVVHLSASNGELHDEVIKEFDLMMS